MEKRTCLRCGHGWYPRKENLPVQCPKCRSPYWNIPRKEITEDKMATEIDVGYSENKSDTAGLFRGAGKCPHGYMNWMVCPSCNDKAGK